MEDRFIRKEQIGNGRMSTVYLALDSASGDAPVALKILNTAHPDEIKQELFKRETRALRRLKHPNVVRMLHSGWSDAEQSFYLVLDFLPYSLDRYLRGELQTQLDNFEKYRAMRELAEALTYAHSQNIVHRDVKPSNILLDVNGRPMLTDFGISKLLTHLTVGETLADFWSGGYASPEQRAGEPTDIRADIYSLGAVFFHLLSGQDPPPEGPSPSLVDKHVKESPPLKNLLKRMLAADPEERLNRGLELLSALEITRRNELVPSHFLILTRTSISNIVASGHATSEDFQTVADALMEDLGGEESNEVYIHRDTRNQDDLIILGDSLRIICTSDEKGDALVVKAVQTPYLPNLDREKERSMQCRAMWMPVKSDFRSGECDSSLRRAAEELSHLLAELDTFENIGAVSQERWRSRLEFIERWDTVLRESRNRIEKEALDYSNVSEEPDYSRFTLTKPPPDNLDWVSDAPLAVRESRQSRIQSVGNLVEIRGRIVEVAKDSRHFHRDDTPIPKAGLLMINTIEASTSIRRQQDAVRAFRNGQMANSQLSNVIVDPSRATRSSEREFDYFQDWLSDDKKEAVRRAVSSNELFLIQGPPGTGKTAVIAEIILQILRQNPDARILLTSQSNIAVDHALTQIASAAGDALPEMIRLGRGEKIGHGGERWTLEERAHEWRQEVLSRCDPVIGELRQAEREAKAAVEATGKLTNFVAADTDTLREWITEAEDRAAQLQEYEQEHAALPSDTPAAVKDEIVEVVEQTRARLRSDLESLNDLLPQPIDTRGMSEEDGLAAIVKAAVSPNLSESDMNDLATRKLHRTRELRKILTEWTKVVGLKPDFWELISLSSRVVAATCLISGKRRTGVPEEEVGFDWAIVDEAGRATVPEVLIPIVQSERVILVGDERQLPPMVDEMISKESDGPSNEYRLDTSLFQSLVEQAEETGHDHLASLRTQYRMRPAIGNLISAVFYEGNLENGEEKRLRRRTFDWMPAPVTWVSTSSLPDGAESRYGESYANSTEADIVLKLLNTIETKCRERRERPSLGVISGYSAQVQELITRIDPEDSSRWQNLRIEIATVDSFQGRECDIVVYSTVRSNRERRIGFLRDYRRINVALSRARDLLVIVGDHHMMDTATIGADPNPFAAVCEHIRQHGNECRVIPPDLANSL